MNKTFLKYHNTVKGFKSSILILLIMIFSMMPFNGNSYFCINSTVNAAELSEENINNNTLSAKGRGIAIVKSDGTVAISGYNNNNQFDARNWTNIKSIYHYGNSIYAVTNDGKVKSINSRQSEEEKISTWTDITMLAIANPDNPRIMGLKSDGTIISTDSYFKVASHWKNIVAIAPYVGLKSDGTVETTLETLQNDVKNWNNIAKVISCVYGSGIIGIKKDGTVVCTGSFSSNDSCKQIENWNNIVDIDVSDNDHIIGLTKDGRVLSAGESYLEGVHKSPADFSKFTDIVAISAGSQFAVGLKKDGSIVMAGIDVSNANNKALYIDIY